MRLRSIAARVAGPVADMFIALSLSVLPFRIRDLNWTLVQ